MPEPSPDARSLPANHDKPTPARGSKHYLGDFGVTQIDGRPVFHLSGALSGSTPSEGGDDWWLNEELSLDVLDQAVALCSGSKPEIVLTRDGPDVATTEILRTKFVHKERHPSRTTQALNAMFDVYQPPKWIFGH